MEKIMVPASSVPTRRGLLATAAAAGAVGSILRATPSYAQTVVAAGDNTIRPFHINVPEDALVDLRRRIAANSDDLPSLVAAWGRSFETGHPIESEHRQRRRLLRPDADNDVMIGPDVVGQIPIGSNVAHADTIGGRSSNYSKSKIGR
jgi:hypothetical protein